MASKLDAEYGATAQTLIDALRAQGAAAASGVHARLGSMLGPGESVPDVAFLFELMARRLEHDRAELERAEPRRAEPPEGSIDPHARRDDAAHELHATLLEAKRSLGALFGGAWTKRLALPVELRQDGVTQLLRAGKDAARALKKRALPKPAVAGLKSIDGRPWQKRLKAAVSELEDAAEALGEGGLDLDDANAGKAKALHAFERTFASAAAAGFGLLELSGSDEAAHKLPRGLRRTRDADAPSAEPAAAPPTPSEET